MKILNLEDIPKTKYICIFSYSLKDGIPQIDSYIKNNSFSEYNSCGMTEKKDYLIDSDENLILFLNEIYDKIILDYSKKEENIQKIFENLEEKNVSIFTNNFKDNNDSQIFKSYFLTIVNIEKGCPNGELNIYSYFDFDRKKLNNYYMHYYAIQNFAIYQQQPGIYVLQYTYFVSFNNFTDDNYYIDKLEEICCSNLINKNHYLQLYKKNRSFCFDIYDYEKVPDNYIYIKSYLINVNRLGIHDYKLIPHLVNASKNRKLKVILEKKYHYLNNNIKNELSKYVFYEAKEVLTYRDLRSEEYKKRYNDSEEEN